MKKKGFTIPGIDVEASRKRIAQMIDESGFTDKEMAEMMDLPFRLSISGVKGIASRISRTCSY